MDRPGAGVIRRVDIDPPGPDDAVVRTLYSAVSRGTESLVFHGATPASQYARMRAPFQDGTASTWRSFGGSGMPHQASRTEQIAVAERVLDAQGWKAWPACSRKLGLR